MTAALKILRDDAARRTAISSHDQSLLVEAGAGSGKTAVMAGRIAAMLAQGAVPKSIAAVTFTELAASELLVRCCGKLCHLRCILSSTLWICRAARYGHGVFAAPPNDAAGCMAMIGHNGQPRYLWLKSNDRPSTASAP